MSMRTADPFGTATRLVRSCTAHPSDTLVRLRIRSLAACLVHKSVPALVPVYWRSVILHSCYVLARQRLISKQVRTLHGTSIIRQRRNQSHPAVGQAAEGESWTVHKPLDPVSQSGFGRTDTSFYCYILVRKAAEASRPVYRASRRLHQKSVRSVRLRPCHTQGNVQRAVWKAATSTFI
jgi:hypothetical protein